MLKKKRWLRRFVIPAQASARRALRKIRRRALEAEPQLRVAVVKAKFAMIGIVHRGRHHLNVRKGLLGVLAMALLFLIVLASAWASGARLAYLADATHLSALQQFLVGIGAALIGASAIVFSIIVFAMQINIDRMPHGLFLRLSADKGLLGAFIAAFAVSILVAGLSLLVSESWVAYCLAIVAWTMCLVPLLFIYSYGRALKLISPAQQLRIVLKLTDRSLGRWSRYADAARVLYQIPEASDERDELREGRGVDTARFLFFKSHSGWTADAVNGLGYAISLGRKYAEIGDKAVLDYAMNIVVAINVAYIKAKARTFFASTLFFDNPAVTDGFINQSLEHLRQMGQLAISRGDEQGIEAIFKALEGLAAAYLDIDYGRPDASMTHAQLAETYLYDSVTACLPRNMANVVMSGLRGLGRIGTYYGQNGHALEVVNSASNIARLGQSAVSQADSLAIEQCAMQQLTGITVLLIQCPAESNLEFALSSIRKTTFDLTIAMLLSMSDGNRFHESSVGSYFSVTIPSALPGKLANIVNALSEWDAISDKHHDDQSQSINGGASSGAVTAARRRQLVRNISDWAESIYDSFKKVMLVSIARRSSATFSIIGWGFEIATVLIAASNLKSSDDYLTSELRKSASWLLGTYSFIPTDKDTIAYVETFQLTEQLFKAACDAQQRECFDVAQETLNQLVLWAFRAGTHQTGWRILETGLEGAVALAGMQVVSPHELLATVTKQLRTLENLPVDLLPRAARNLRESAAELFRRAHSTSSIDRALGRCDRETARPLLEAIANLLSPAAQ